MRFWNLAAPYPYHSFTLFHIWSVDLIVSCLKLTQTNVQIMYEFETIITNDTNFLMTVNTANMSFFDSFCKKFLFIAVAFKFKMLTLCFSNINFVLLLLLCLFVYNISEVFQILQFSLCFLGGFVTVRVLFNFFFLWF